MVAQQNINSGMSGMKRMLQGDDDWMEDWEKEMESAMSGMGWDDGSGDWGSDAIVAMLWGLVITFWVMIGVRCFFTYVMMKFYQEGKVLQMGGERDQAAHPCRP